MSNATFHQQPFVSCSPPIFPPCNNPNNLPYILYLPASMVYPPGMLPQEFHQESFTSEGSISGSVSSNISCNDSTNTFQSDFKQKTKPLSRKDSSEEPTNVETLKTVQPKCNEGSTTDTDVKSSCGTTYSTSVTARRLSRSSTTGSQGNKNAKQKSVERSLKHKVSQEGEQCDKHHKIKISSSSLCKKVVVDDDEIAKDLFEQLTSLNEIDGIRSQSKLGSPRPHVRSTTQQNVSVIEHGTSQPKLTTISTDWIVPRLDVLQQGDCSESQLGTTPQSSNYKGNSHDKCEEKIKAKKIRDRTYERKLKSSFDDLRKLLPWKWKKRSQINRINTLTFAEEHIKKMENLIRGSYKSSSQLGSVNDTEGDTAAFHLENHVDKTEKIVKDFVSNSSSGPRSPKLPAQIPEPLTPQFRRPSFSLFPNSPFSPDHGTQQSPVQVVPFQDIIGSPPQMLHFSPTAVSSEIESLNFGREFSNPSCYILDEDSHTMQSVTSLETFPSPTNSTNKDKSVVSGLEKFNLGIDVGDPSDCLCCTECNCEKEVGSANLVHSTRSPETVNLLEDQGDDVNGTSCPERQVLLINLHEAANFPTQQIKGNGVVSLDCYTEKDLINNCNSDSFILLCDDVVSSLENSSAVGNIFQVVDEDESVKDTISIQTSELQSYEDEQTVNKQEPSDRMGGITMKYTKGQSGRSNDENDAFVPCWMPEIRTVNENKDESSMNCVSVVPDQDVPSPVRTVSVRTSPVVSAKKLSLDITPDKVPPQSSTTPRKRKQRASFRHKTKISKLCL